LNNKYQFSLQDYILWTDKTDQRNGIHAVRGDTLEKVRGILHPDTGLSSQLITFDILNQPDYKSTFLLSAIHYKPKTELSLTFNLTWLCDNYSCLL